MKISYNIIDTIYIAYYRVSTKDQGESGLGLAAQRADIIHYLKGQLPYKEFTDIESGKNDQRHSLILALEECKRLNAILLIAKLDRLSRKVSFISQLMESQIKFICCDMPNADPFTLHVRAAIAEEEREMISRRIKAALKIAKEKGTRLGTKSPHSGNQASIIARRKAKERYIETLKPEVKKLINKGLTLDHIALELNYKGFRTTTNKMLTQNHVRSLLK